MCGIFGAVSSKGPLSRQQMDFIRQATITGQLRGEDGTGWILQTPAGEVTSYKKAMTGTDFLESRIGRKGMRDLNKAQAVIGHNRKTTSGSDTDGDCHPYDYDSLIGVHNGTLPPHILNRLDKGDPVARVDSAELYAAIDKADDPTVVLNKLHMGSFALAWIDKATNEICLTRNDERPLWASSGDDGLYFSSEPGMLFWLMSRNGLEAEDSKLFSLKPNFLYRIPMDKPAAVKRQKYEPKAPVYTAPKNRGNRNKADNKSKGGLAPVTTNSLPKDETKSDWYNQGKEKSQHYRYMQDHTLLGRAFPCLDYYTAIIDTNLNLIHEEYKTKEKPDGGGKPTRLDMVVTDVQPRDQNAMYPNIYGFLQDSTEADHVVPIALTAVKDDGYDFVERFERAEKKGKHFTVRCNIASIRICADSSLVVYGTIVNVWDNRHNVEKTDDTSLAGLEAIEAATTLVNELPYKECEAMWDKLESGASVSVPKATN